VIDQLDLGVVARHLRDAAVAHTAEAAVAGPEAAKPALEEEQANDPAGDDAIAPAGGRFDAQLPVRFTISTIAAPRAESRRR
jgi:hypothetical protein